VSYLVIARKYRPLKFEDVIGQEHVTRTLTNAINMNKVHHAYIFTGPRGVGKTTISRVLAKALNCETGITATPCGICNNCREIDSGSSMDVREIDGASNRGIDEIRNLRDEIKFAPASCRKKIYIIDEVHMLTNQAFNALLKTLEEPPAHALFIFATTEINEVPATILSRCQRHDFKRVSIETMTKSLSEICQKESVNIDSESLLMIARAGDGSVRDSQSVLDQVIAYSGLNITATGTAEALGIPGQEKYFDYFNLVRQKDQKALLNFIEDLVQNGLHTQSFLKGLLEFVRNLLILQSTKEHQLIALTADNIQRMQSFCGMYSDNDLLFFLDLLSRGISGMKNSAFQRIDFEILLLKIFHYTKTIAIEELLNKLSALEKSSEPDLDSLTEEVAERLKKKIDLIPRTEFIPAAQPVSAEIKTVPPLQEPVITVETETPADSETVEIGSENNDENPEINIISADESEVAVRTEETVHPELTVTDNIIVPEETEPHIEQQSAVPPLPSGLAFEFAEEEKRNRQRHHADSHKTEVHAINDDLNFVKISADWPNLIAFMSSKIPSLGKMLDYSVPVGFTDKVLTVKFAPRHNSFKNLAEYKVRDLQDSLNGFYQKHGLTIRLIEENVADHERLIKVSEEQFMSEDELKNQLLKEAPQLEFLFEKPLSCKIIK